MNLTKKIATLGALAVVGAFTVSNAANVGVINEEAIYTGYNGFGAIQMQIDKLRAEYGPKLEGEFKKLNNFKYFKGIQSNASKHDPLGIQLGRQSKP